MNKIKPIVSVPFSGSSRKKVFEQIHMQDLDMLVLGGGITGAGCLRDGAIRQLKCLLIEEEDFAFGTSAYSSKFIHGGLRYLETFDLGLVWEGLRERQVLLKTASDLVFSSPFLVPIYQDSRRPLWQVSIACWLYYVLGLGSHLPKPKILSPDHVEPWAPHLSTHKLNGGVLYYDASTIDTALVMANLQDAWTRQCPALNYARIEDIQFEASKEKFFVKLVDKRSDCSAIVSTRWIVNATGPWSDITQKHLNISGASHQLRLTQGTHLILDDKLPQPKAAMVTEHPQDGRVTFIYPWMGKTIVGTTDTDFSDHPSRATCTEQDRAYLLTLYNHYFPEAAATRNNIVAEFSGVRPLVSPKSSRAFKPSDISRKHVLDEPIPQFLSIQGGKLTSYRKMAEDVLNYITKTTRASRTRELHLPTPKSFFLARTSGQMEQAFHEAYVHEMCLTPEDFFKRRTWLHYLNPQLAHEHAARAEVFFEQMKTLHES